MKYVLVEDGKAVTIGVDKALFPQAVEAPDDIIFGDTYVNGEFQRTAERTEPSEEVLAPSIEDRVSAIEDALLMLL